MSLRGYTHHASFAALAAILALGSITSIVSAATQSGSLTASATIVQPVDESNLVVIAGSTHPLAIAKYDEGAVPDSLSMEHLFLQLRRSGQEEQALEQLMIEQQDPHAANYHKWLTADQFGRNFGPAQQDIEAIVSWLQLHGLRVNTIYPSAMIIDISGTAAQVRDTFHTEIHRYNIGGEEHIANSSDPQIPAALAPAIVGVTSLNDFMPKPASRRPGPSFSIFCKGCPNGFDNLELYDEGPADFATVYNVNPIYKAGITGKGQTIAVLEDSDMRAGDWSTFRQAFGLSSYSGTFAQIHPAPPSGPNNCASPGTNGDEFEAALDAEWSGAVAPDAAIKLASCADTATTFGGDMAAYNLINSPNPPPIISYSYGQCEANLGPSGNEFYRSTWQQAAAEGISMYVIAGDWAAAVCDASFASGVFATAGISVNGLGSTPYNVAVGGTDFSDVAAGTANSYWSKSNGPKRESAKSYIPEMTWNDSCAGSVLFDFYGYTNGVDFCNSSIGSNFINIVAGSGGPSFVYSKPYWQSVFGNPSDGKRDLPDVSLFSSGFWDQAIVLCMSDPAQGGAPCDYTNPTDVLFNSGYGTSFATPQFAGIQALINEKAGGRQGNPAPIIYDLARADYGNSSSPNMATLEDCNASKGNGISSSCTFHDITLGNNDVPCYGTNNCYDPSPADYGVLSISDKSLRVAYPATPGWDFTTGLGSVNVANLVNRWP